jgi:hypothetical protein
MAPPPKYKSDSAAKTTSSPAAIIKLALGLTLMSALVSVHKSRKGKKEKGAWLRDCPDITGTQALLTRQICSRFALDGAYILFPLRLL